MLVVVTRGAGVAIGTKLGVIGDAVGHSVSATVGAAVGSTTGDALGDGVGDGVAVTSTSTLYVMAQSLPDENETSKGVLYSKSFTACDLK